jgi:DNA-directed RNA polymerase sigma subunit (sigma70/sigma32)
MDQFERNCHFLTNCLIVDMRNLSEIDGDYRVDQYKKQRRILQRRQKKTIQQIVETLLECPQIKLSRQEKEMLKLRYGLGGNEYRYGLSECAQIYQYTHAGVIRIRQIETDALKKCSDLASLLTMTRH